MKIERLQHSVHYEIGKLDVSVFKHGRAARYHFERNEHYIKFGWSNPAEHKWWARTIYIRWN